MTETAERNFEFHTPAGVYTMRGPNAVHAFARFRGEWPDLPAPTRVIDCYTGDNVPLDRITTSKLRHDFADDGNLSVPIRELNAAARAMDKAALDLAAANLPDEAKRTAGDARKFRAALEAAAEGGDA